MIMKWYGVYWVVSGETYCRSFLSTEEDFMNQFISDLQERLNVECIEKVTHETIPC